MFRCMLLRRAATTAVLAQAAATTFLIAGIPPALAQTGEPREGGSPWALGLGAIAVDKAYRSSDREFYALPIVSFENRWISASVPTFDIKLFSGESVSFRLRARWSGDGYEAEDSPFLEGMDERKSSLWAGGTVVWKSNVVNLSAEVLADAMDESKGTRAKVQLDRRFGLRKFGITPRLAAEWVDDKYVDYYYGVSAPEARSDRPAYQGKATTNLQTGVRLDYTPARHHTVFVDVAATRFGSTIDDSPLVDEPKQLSFGLGYVYRF